MKNLISFFFFIIFTFQAYAQSDIVPFYASQEAAEQTEEDNWKAFYIQASPLGFSNLSIFRPEVPIDDIVNFRDNLGAGYAYELNVGFYFNSFTGISFTYTNSSFSDQFNRSGELFYKNELDVNTYSISLNNLRKGLREQDLFYYSYGLSYFDLGQEFTYLAGNYQRRASGNGFGLRTEIGYNYHLFDQLFLNFSSNFIVGSITSIRSYTPDASYRLNELEEDTTTLLQFNVLVGFTYYLPF